MDRRAHIFEEGLATEDLTHGLVGRAGRRFAVRIASSSLMLAGFALVLLIGAGAVAFFRT